MHVLSFDSQSSTGAARPLELKNARGERICLIDCTCTTHNYKKCFAFSLRILPFTREFVCEFTAYKLKPQLTPLSSQHLAGAVSAFSK
jgi:hypothetical protein